MIEASAAAVAVTSQSLTGFEIAYAVVCLASGAWVGAAAAAGFSMVPSEHRMDGVALYFTVTSLAGTALGPWVAGAISDRWGSIAFGLVPCLPIVLIAIILLLRLARPDDA
jgi:MFS family permease